MTVTKAKIPVMLIAGCTAAGKSALALQFARLHLSTIINGDSMQVYKELPILTAQPTSEDQAVCPHKLYGVLAGDDVCSVARWQALALTEIHRSYDESRQPLVVGGSGLYLRSLTQGLSQIPPVNMAIREEARSLYQKWGALKFHQQLQDIDPAMAERLHPGDKQRIARAWEVMKSTGISLAVWQQKLDSSMIAHLDCRIIVLDPPREELKQRADLRLRKMLEAGAIEEVKALERYGYDAQLPVMKALGVAELRKHLAGEFTLAQAVERIEIKTRQYIKRQSTWFRASVPKSGDLCSGHFRCKGPDEKGLCIKRITLDLITT